MTTERFIENKFGKDNQKGISVPKWLLVLNIFLTLLYFIFIVFLLPPGDPILFGLLVFGEIFHVWQTITYIYTIWEMDYKPKFDSSLKPWVDIFITVAGEPVELVRETVIAAKNIDYPHFKVHILNDGFVAKKDNWEQIEDMAMQEGINCITRTQPGGAKAGNVNNALRQTKNPFVVIFDADHQPHRDFLKETVGHFSDEKVAFVQTPQFYENYLTNELTKSAWEQQELFFEPICRGKNRLNSTFMCGTNVIIKRSALEEVGGMCETNIAEDFITSLFIHKRGWKSIYVPKILAKGLAPEDFLSYYKQQLRWARGSLEIVFKYNPLFSKHLTFAQKIQYLASASFYLSGIVVAIDALLPLAYLYTGRAPLNTSTLALALIFLPYIFFNMYALRLSNNLNYTFRALAFSVSSFSIFVTALWGVLGGKKAKFAVTSKTKIDGSFYYLAWPHLCYIALAIGGFFAAAQREGLNASVITNISWAVLNISFFVPFIEAAVNKLPSLSLSSLKPNFNFSKKASELISFLF